MFAEVRFSFTITKWDYEALHSFLKTRDIPFEFWINGAIFQGTKEQIESFITTVCDHFKCTARPTYFNTEKEMRDINRHQRPH